MEGLAVGLVGAKPQKSTEKQKPGWRRSSGLLRRLALTVSSTSSSTPAERGTSSAMDSQDIVLKPKSEQNQQQQQHQHQHQHQQQPQRAPSFGGILSSLAAFDVSGSPPIRRWTPPLSPTGKSVKCRPCDVENHPSAEESVAMLRLAGLPPLERITALKFMVGAAPRAWVLDFRIRGGRSHVNAKLSEIGIIEAELNHHRMTIVAVVPKFLTRRSTRRGHATPTARDLAETKDELVQVLLYLHLRR